MTSQLDFIAPGEKPPITPRSGLSLVTSESPLLERESFGAGLTDFLYGLHAQALERITMIDPSEGMPWLTVFDSQAMAPFKRSHDDLITLLGERVPSLSRRTEAIGFGEPGYVKTGNNNEGTIILRPEKSARDRVYTEAYEVRAVLLDEQAEGAPETKRFIKMKPRIEIGRGAPDVDMKHVEWLLKIIRLRTAKQPVVGSLEAALEFEDM